MQLKKSYKKLNNGKNNGKILKKEKRKLTIY
jgi:hypothetical protein